MVTKEQRSALQNTVDTKKSAVFYFVTTAVLTRRQYGLAILCQTILRGTVDAGAFLRSSAGQISFRNCIGNLTR